MKAPEQQYNNYPTLTKDSPSDSIPNTYGASSENDLLSGTENSVNKKKTNKRRKINKSKRRKIKRRPQKQRVIQEVIVKTFDTFIKTVL